MAESSGPLFLDLVYQKTRQTGYFFGNRQVLFIEKYMYRLAQSLTLGRQVGDFVFEMKYIVFDTLMLLISFVVHDKYEISVVICPVYR